MTALSKPLATMTEEKKSYMNKLKKGIQTLFNKEAKKSAENETQVAPKTQAKPPVKMTKVTTLLENFEKLKLENESNNKETIDDELKNFNIKTVKCDADKNDARNDSVSSNDSGFSVKTVKSDADKDTKPVKNDARNDSVSSNDSGFSDKDDNVAAKSETDDTSDLVESLNVLEIDDKKKSKKSQTVYISRAPVRNKLDHNSSHPYNYQINRTIFSGGTVTYNTTYNANDVDTYKNLENDPAQDIEKLIVDKSFDNTDLRTYNANDETSRNIDNDPAQITEKLIVENPFDDTDLHNILKTIEAVDDNPVGILDETNPNLFLTSNVNNYTPDFLSDFGIFRDLTETYPSPPRSNENVFFPESLSPNATFYPSPPYQNVRSPNSVPLSNHNYQEFNNTEVSPLSNYSLSSDGLLKTDDEEQVSFEESDIPSCVFDTAEELREDEAHTPKPRERIRSSSSVTMKQYKGMQNELHSEFSKKDCCLEIPKNSSKEFFREHFMELDADKRKNLCLQVAKLDLKTTGLGVLQNVIINVSTITADQGLLFALFGLICERVLAEEPELFLNDFGLSLLKASALRCPALPMLTRHVSRYVRLALKHAVRDAKEPVFKETDTRGDNLLAACARRGDACADVLAELVRRDDVTMPPLFDVAHVNSEGHSALHVACLSHGAHSCLHVVHVLLTHAHADLYQGDIKGGDTALHLAVNSVSCDLRLVMTLFKHVDRKLWKKLAHSTNRSSVTPLEYARSATKASTRQNYPHEVLNFLKKCR